MIQECKSDLLLRARAGNASDAELIALEAHLITCASCRLTREVGRDFDAIGGAEPGDAERIARMAAAARRAPQLRGSSRVPSLRPRQLRRAWVLALAAILVGGVAAATGLLRAGGEAPSPAEATGSGVVEHGAGSAALRPASSGAASASLVDEDPSAAAAEPSGRPEPGAPGARVRTATAAGVLYRAANEARRTGDRARAVRLYRELQRDYPGSPEAKLSRVSLGSLLLDDGSAAQAAEQFDAYASAPGSQRLGAEALYGKGRALMSLGRRVEEIRTWQRLLREYPDSPYAAHARRRLAELR